MRLRLSRLWAEDDSLKGLSSLRLCFVQVVMHLQIQPKLRAGSQFVCKIECGIGSYSALAVDQLVELRHGPAQTGSKRALRSARRIKKFLQKHSPGMNWICRTHNDS